MLKYRDNYISPVAFHRFIVMLYIAASINCMIAAEFDYEKGTFDWVSIGYPNCSGKHQSPINIMTSSVKKNSYKPIEKYGPSKGLSLVTFTNNGHTVQISPKADSSRETVTGGPMNDQHYKFGQMHFHWGKNDQVGSETQINDKRFPLELHLVFFNAKYGNASYASNFPDGLTVMAVLYKVDRRDNPALEYTQKFKQISEFNATIEYNFNGRSYSSFLPQSRNSFYTYSGSLTTPPCNEAVTWIVFIDRVPISSSQLMNFRSFKTKNGKVLMENYRPVQPLNDRVVYVNKYIETMLKEEINELTS